MAQVLIGGKETESGQRALAVLKSVNQHWVPDARILCTHMEFAWAAGADRREGDGERAARAGGAEEREPALGARRAHPVHSHGVCMGRRC